MGSKKIKENNRTINNKKSNKNSQKSKLIVVVIAIAVASIGIIGFMTTSASENNNNTNSSSQNLTGKWMDVHGVGISSAAGTNDHKNLLYLATHNGLFKKDIGDNSSSSSNASGWVEVGSDKSDLMGLQLIQPIKVLCIPVDILKLVAI